MGMNLKQYLNLVRIFFQVSTQQEMAYRANFFINLLYSMLNFSSGILGIYVIFSQVEAVQGWTFSATLVVLGVYLLASAIRDLFIGPSLESLVGMDGEVWQGTFDFTLLKPVSIQFLASFRKWRPFVLFDLVLGLIVLGTGVGGLARTIQIPQLLQFLMAFLSGCLVVYALLLFFTSMVFWSPGFLFTWVFNDLFQMARYPVGLYPGVFRLLLTWIIPVGVITTIPAQALTGELKLDLLAASVLFSVVLVVLSSVFFRKAIRRYSSASS